MFHVACLSYPLVSGSFYEGKANQTFYTLNQLPPYAPLRSVVQLQGEFTEVSEVGAALDDENISMIVLCPQDFVVDVVAIPGSDALRDVVQMIMTSENKVYAV